MGNGNKMGSACNFPFEYEGKTYNECTEVDASFKWCYTVDGGKPGDPWGQCLTCLTYETQGPDVLNYY